MSHFTSAGTAAKFSPGLSKMQEAVTHLVCEGLSTDDIAKRLGLSRTILNHHKVVYRKLGVSSRSALVVEAMKRNIAA